MRAVVPLTNSEAHGEMSLDYMQHERDEAPYEGPSGATYSERVLLPDGQGAARSIELVRRVNAHTHPMLALRAREGTLHRFEPWGDLAVPYVYHDPARRLFVLVIPVCRAHDELTMRAELLLQLARETSHPMPGYVRAARAVLGSGALRAVLTKGVAPKEPAHGVSAPAAPLDTNETIEEAEPVDDDAHELDPESEPIEPEEFASTADDVANRGRNEGAIGGRSAAGHAAMVDGEARIWAVGTESDASELRSTKLEVSAELDPEGFPLLRARVCTMAPAPPDGERVKILAQVVLDATRPDDRAVLEALAHGAALRVDLVSRARRALGTGFAPTSPSSAAAFGHLLEALRDRPEGDSSQRLRRAEQWRAELDAEVPSPGRVPEALASSSAAGALPADRRLPAAARSDFDGGIDDRAPREAVHLEPVDQRPAPASSTADPINRRD